MKLILQKAILFSLACFLILTKVNAQTTEFAPPNAIWYYGFINSEGEEGLYYTKFQVEKDTLFQGHLSTKVNSKRYNAPSSFTELSNQYVFTSNDTVFYYNFNFSKYLPLYVFNVKKGDTLKFHVPFSMASLPDTFRVVIDSVFDVIIDGTKLKQVKTSYLDHFALYSYTERLGNGSFIGHHPTMTTGFWNFLSCYQDGIIDVNLTNKACDFLKTSNIHSISTEILPLVYPNPSNGAISISYSIPPTGTINAKVYDLLGRVVHQEQLTFSSKETSVNLNISNGSYILELKDELGNMQRERIVIE